MRCKLKQAKFIKNFTLEYMVIIILTNQLTLTLTIIIIILQSNFLTNSYFPPYSNYSFKSFDPPLRSRRSFIILTRPRRSFGEGREGAGKGGCDQRRTRAKGAAVWQRRARERERKEWRERATSRAFTGACHVEVYGAAELGHVTGRCHGGILATPPCIVR